MLRAEYWDHIRVFVFVLNSRACEIRQEISSTVLVVPGIWCRACEVRQEISSTDLVVPGIW